MTRRERFRAALAFEPLDEPSHLEHGLLPETMERWWSEGLPRSTNAPVIDYYGPRPQALERFGALRCGYLLLGQHFRPNESRVLERTETYEIAMDDLGRTVKQFLDHSSAPQYLDFEVKTRGDYYTVKERLQPDVDARYPENWDEIAAYMRTQDECIVAPHFEGFYGFPRQLIGDENLLMSYYTDPEFIREVIQDRCDFYITLYEKAIREVPPDMAFIWEDMCFRGGSLIGPELFREFMMPAYRRLLGWLKDMGVRNIVVDSDGDVRTLLPLWLEAGVTGVLPFEVKAGMDVVTIGWEFPGLQIIGGIDKHALERGPSAIDAELERVVPAMLRRGGYVASLDHWVHPQIPLENFAYYSERLHACRP